VIDPRDKQEIIDRYTERIKSAGHNVTALGSGSDAHQIIRYRVMSEIADLGGQHVLDVGCGFGGFLKYCRHFDQPMTYTGIDIVPEMLRIAEENNPAGEFIEADIVDGLMSMEDKSFDYVVSSQAFNNRYNYSDNLEIVRIAIQECFRLARKGVAIDMMSTHVDFQEERLFYFDPGEIFACCKTLTKRVTLRHDYPLFEFCVYLFPDFQGWK
jgi:ubiquinone/menaquinone biosynthesis C-methylase UbiE